MRDIASMLQKCIYSFQAIILHSPKVVYNIHRLRFQSNFSFICFAKSWDEYLMFFLNSPSIVNQLALIILPSIAINAFAISSAP